MILFSLENKIMLNYKLKLKRECGMWLLGVRPVSPNSGHSSVVRGLALQAMQQPGFNSQ